MLADALLPDECVPGTVFAITYGMHHPRNACWSVRAIVDGRAVCRTLDKDTKRWRYDCFGPGYFRVNERNIEWRAEK